MIDEAEMMRLEPGLRPGMVQAAAISDNDGHVQGTLVAQTCASRVQEMGGSIMAGSPVTGLAIRSERIASVQLPGGSMPCDVVVLAAGVGTTNLAAMAGVHVPQEESPGVVVSTEPMPPVLTIVAALYAPPLRPEGQSVHLRQSTDGVVLLGEGSQEGLARDDSPEHAADILARASVYLPELASATAIPVPVGYRPMPIDGLPVLGFTRAVPNLYIALMHSGITLAPVIGELATMEILDAARVDILEHYRPERFAVVVSP